MAKSQSEINSIVKFVKLCLKDEGHSKELIAYLFSTYDLNTFIGEDDVRNKLEIATGFLAHARQIDEARHF
jgi:hypothetical protein